MPTSLVTGSGGFTGGHLVDALLTRGDDVIGLDLRAPEAPSGARFVEADLRDREAVMAACEGVDTVFHCASLVHTRRNRVEDVRAVNVDGARNVIDACRKQGVPKLVYVSSASVVYEGHDIERGDESLPYASRVLAPYAETKIVAEREVLAANDGETLRTCAIRPHVVFGPGDTRFIPAILLKGREGKLRFSIGWRNKLSDFTYVSNVIDALLLADEKLTPGSPVAGQAYFITNGEPTPFWEFVRRVVEPLGYPTPRFPIPYSVAYAAATVRETLDTLRGGTIGHEEGLSRFTVRYLCTHHYFTHQNATADLGYRPKVSIREGIERTIEAFRG